MGFQVLMKEGQDPVLLVVEAMNLYEACEMLGGEIEFETAFAFIRFDVEKLLRDKRWRELTEEEVGKILIQGTKVFELTDQSLFISFLPGQESTRLEFSSPPTLKKIGTPISPARV